MKEKILTQHCIENKRRNANHEGKNFEYEQSRQLTIEGHEVTIIRTNPDAADFYINKLINQIYTQIIKSTKNH